MNKKWKRKIVRCIPNVSFKTLSEMGLENCKIERVWTILDEGRMLEGDKFDPYTGEKIESPIKKTLDNATLHHGVTAFVEDKMHDWNVKGDIFKYYTRIAKEGEECDLLVEYTELK